MQYQPYKNYKLSNVGWIHEVPSHWATWKVTHGFGLIGSGTTPKSNNSAYYENGDTAWITTSELREKVIFETKFKVSKEALRDYSTLKVYEPGALAFAMYGATIGRLGILGIKATVNQACCVFDKPEKFDTKFFFYWLWMRRDVLISLSVGGGQPNLSQDDLKAIRAPVPPIEEQAQIARFLEHKTRQIDDLIEKKKALIEKLDEQRIAVITQAVTKGINGKAKMKPSGVDWIGEVPNHWEVKRLKFFVKSLNSGVSVNAEQVPAQGDEYGVLKTSCVYGNEFRASENKRIFSSEISRASCPVRADSIIISRMNTPELVGHCGYVGKDHSNLFLPDRLWIARFHRDFDGVVKYFWYLLSSKGAQSKTETMATGASASMKNLTQPDYLSMRLAVPNSIEQKSIVDFLDVEISKICKLKRVNYYTIDRLLEYRRALVTSAVTGKIDVRNIQIPKGE